MILNLLLIVSEINCYFVQDSIYKKLINRIDSARYSIDICFYEIHDTFPDTLSAPGSRVINALRRAKVNRGINKIRIITDDENLRYATRLRTIGIPVFSDSGIVGRSYPMHNKFAIFDYRDYSETTLAWVWTGSYNASENIHADNAIEIQSESLARLYTLEFNQMWGDTGDLPNQDSARFHRQKRNLLPYRRVNIGEYQLGVYFSPQDSAIDSISKEVAKAESSITFCIFAFAISYPKGKVIADSMVRKWLRRPDAVWVGGVFCASEANQSWSAYPYLQDSGLLVYRDRVPIAYPGGKLHHKFIVIDGKATITGSMNWSEAGNRTSDENTLIIYGPPGNGIASAYTEEFFRRFNEAGHDVGVAKILSPTGEVDSGIFIPACSVYNRGIFTEGYNVRMKIGSFYNKGVYVSNHNPLSIRYVTFPPCTLPRGRHILSCSTELWTDSDRRNDKKGDSVLVQVKDVGVSALISPQGIVDSGVSVVPACTVYNYGTTTETYSVKMKIGEFYDNTAIVFNHLPETKFYLTFPPWDVTQRGAHLVSCSTEFSLDANPSNNKETGLVSVQVKDVGTIEIISPPASVDSGEVITPKAKVGNFGTTNETFDVTFFIEGPIKWSSTRTVSNLAPDEERVIEFDPWTAQPRGRFLVKCTTQLAGDMNSPNDKLEAELLIRVQDVGTTEITTPVGDIDSTVSIIPKAKVKNFGSLPSTFDVSFSIGGPIKWSSTKTVSDLAPDEEREVEFDTWQVSGRGDYVARCTTKMSGDMIPENDKLERNFSILVKDCGVLGFLLPYKNMNSGDYHPQVKFKNYGTETANFTAKAIIGHSALAQGIGSYIGTANITNLLPNDTITALFQPVWNAQAGIYVAFCSLDYFEDMIPDNNILSLQFRVKPFNNGWVRMADLNGTKPVKSGGCLTAMDSSIYGLIGNNTLDFMRYSISENSWSKIGNLPEGERGKRVKRGACITNDGHYIYVVKGNNTKEFYSYDLENGKWDTLPEPQFTKGIKGGFITHIKRGETSYIYLGNGGNNNEWQRFNCKTKLWETCEPATLPAEKFKVGSSIASYEDSLLYLLRAGGKTNEFYCLNLNTLPLTWTRKSDLPLASPGGRKKKVKEGASLVYANVDRKLYCIKGGNTKEFWQYDPAVDSWRSKEDVGYSPSFGSGEPSGVPAKGIKGGGGLTYSSYDSLIYCAIGNNTNEFWVYSGPSEEGLVMSKIAHPFIGNGVKNLVKDGMRFSYHQTQKEKVKIQVWTILGSMIYEGEAESDFFTLKNLPAGVYILSFKTLSQRDKKGCEEKRKIIVIR